MMQLHVLQHVDFEAPTGIADWAHERGHRLNYSHLYRGYALPGLDDFDMLVIMGGPMNIYEDAVYPYLDAERKFIKDAIAAEKYTLGICLGAQLIADALGSSVYAGQQKEIGWWPLHKAKPASSPKARQIQAALADNHKVLHWHGDTFDIPDDCEHLFQTENCPAQAFLHAGRVLALQFHLEMDAAAVERLCENCSEELEAAGAYVQSAADILHSARIYPDQTRPILFKILDLLVAE